MGSGNSTRLGGTRSVPFKDLGWALFARRYLGHRYGLHIKVVWANTNTTDVYTAFVFFSSGYWDVSVRRVCFPLFSRRDLRGSPIGEPPDLGLLPAPRGVSPVAAPFFAFERQGVLRKPVIASLQGLFDPALELRHRVNTLFGRTTEPLLHC